MTLNLSKHGAEMQAAWKKVCDGKDPTDWALYGYEGKFYSQQNIILITYFVKKTSLYTSLTYFISLGNTFDLKLISTGEDGIEEMIEDLNANKILYAFIKGNFNSILLSYRAV